LHDRRSADLDPRNERIPTVDRGRHVVPELLEVHAAFRFWRTGGRAAERLAPQLRARHADLRPQPERDRLFAGFAVPRTGTVRLLVQAVEARLQFREVRRPE